MSLKALMSGLIAVQMSLVPNFVMAQSSNLNSDFERSFVPQTPEARIRLSIPLGESASPKKMAPRLDFAIRNYSQLAKNDSTWTRSGQPVFDQNNSSEMRLGFTLDKDPQWMLNDQALQFDLGDDQANIGTAGKIGLGVVAVALVGMAVIGVILVSCDDDPGGCFGDE